MEFLHGTSVWHCSLKKQNIPGTWVLQVHRGRLDSVGRYDAPGYLGIVNNSEGDGQANAGRTAGAVLGVGHGR